MPHKFDHGLETHIIRHEDGWIRRELLHAEPRYVAAARRPRLAAGECLERFGSAPGIRHGQLRRLDPSPGGQPSFWRERQAARRPAPARRSPVRTEYACEDAAPHCPRRGYRCLPDRERRFGIRLGGQPGFGGFCSTSGERSDRD